MIPLPRPCLCLVTNRRALTPDARTIRDEILALERLLEEAIAARIDLIQIREGDLEASVLRDLTVRVRACATEATRILVNDRADVAIAARAAGVHLRADAPGTAAVRALAPAHWLVGRSVHHAAEAAAHDDADYLLFGTVFESGSKPGQPASGVDALGAAVRAARAPVLAIGGLTPDRVPACAAAGAWGVAAIGVFLPPGRTPDSLGPGPAAEALRAAFARQGC